MAKSILIAAILFPLTAGHHGPSAPKQVDLPVPSQWMLLSGEFQGDKFKDATAFELKARSSGKLVFSGDTFSMKYELDSRSDPCKIDMSLLWTGHPDIPWAAHAGIYRFDGLHLTLCIAWTDGAERPTEFRTTRGDGRLLLVFKQKRT